MSAAHSPGEPKVGIVIVSHSPDIARGTADMVRQMVGDTLRVAWCGGNPAGGLGTDVAAGEGERHRVADHLAHHVGRALGHLGRVRDDDDAHVAAHC